MSRSNNSESTNPADKFFEWSGAEGGVKYYDKDTKVNVSVPFPFKFLVLDRMAQVTGGVDTNDGYLGYWSNAVRNINSEPFVVRSKKGIVAEGFYRDIKATAGIKFMTGLYIAYKGDGLRIGHLALKGSSLTPWIDFTSKHKNIFAGAFAIIDKAEKKKGTNTYYEPVFAHYDDVSDETDQQAQALDKELQVYLTAYFSKNKAEEVSTTDEEARAFVGEDFTNDEIPF